MRHGEPLYIRFYHLQASGFINIDDVYSNVSGAQVRLYHLRIHQIRTMAKI